MIKATMLFTQSTNKSGEQPAQVRVGGWSETWYCDDTIANVRANFAAVCQVRARMLSNAAAIIGQRYQVLGSGSQTGVQVFPGRAGVPADVPQMGLMLTVPGKDVPNIRRFTLRGIPDAIVVEGEYSPTAAFSTALTQFFGALGRGGFAMRGRDRATPPTQVISVVPTVVAGNTFGTFTLGTPLTFAVGTKLKFVRTRDIYGRTVDGEFLVTTATDSTHGVVSLWDFGDVNGGEVRVSGAPIFPEIESSAFAVGRIVVRKVGRPFNQYRGKASAKR